MSIALLVFGQFRAYEEVFEANILELKKSFPSFDIFILTDKLPSGLYSEEAEKYIRDVLDKHSVRIKLFSYWEDLKDLHATDKLMGEFSTKFLNKMNLSPENLWMVNLWYRRYILWKLFETMNESYDYCIFARPFDTTIQLLKSIALETDTLYISVDTFFIGSPPIMKKLFMFGSTMNWSNSEWSEDFWKAFATFDHFIANSRNRFCSESQIFYYIYNTIKWKNIRWDFTNPEVTDGNYHIEIKRACRIPKRILQIAIGETYIQSLPLTQIKNNFAHNNYEYVLFKDKECIEFLSNFFPQYIPLFHILARPQYKSDLIRYLYLYQYGGWYIDMDLLPLLPLNVIYEKTQFASLICAEGAHTTHTVKELANGFLAARAKNPVFLDLVEQMKADPNPADYGANVKRIYKAFDKAFLFKEIGHEGKYYICHGNEVICLSNGHGYPSLNGS